MDRLAPQRAIQEVDIPTCEERFQRTATVVRRYKCPYFTVCTESFYFYRELDNHLCLKHECHCGGVFPDLSLHMCIQPPMVGGGLLEPPADLRMGMFHMEQNVHRGAYLTFKVDFRPGLVHTFEDAFELVHDSLYFLLQQLIRHYSGLKVSISIQTTMERLSDKEPLERRFIGVFVTHTSIAFLNRNVLTSCDYLLTSLSLYTDESSGWAVKAIHSLDCRTLPYRPRLGRGRAFLETPKPLRRLGLVNVRTMTQCFYMSVLAGVYMDKIAPPPLKKRKGAREKTFAQLQRSEKVRLTYTLQNPKTYLEISKKFNKLNFQNFENSVSVEEIPIFEHMNKIKINVFSYYKEKVIPTYVSLEPYEKQINLLLLSEELETETKYHYTLIPDLGKLFGKTNYAKASVCNYCLQPFKVGLEKHMERCQVISKKVLYFMDDKEFTFKKFSMFQDVYYKVFIHLIPYAGPPVDISVDESKLKYTNKLGNLSLAGYCILIVDITGKVVFSTSYAGPLAMEKFMVQLLDETDKIYEKVHNLIIPIPNDDVTKNMLLNTTTCRFCNRKFCKELNVIPCRHHNHTYDLEIQVICLECNIKIFKTSHRIISSQLCDKDAMLILKGLKEDHVGSVEIIARNSETIISFGFQKRHRFLDAGLVLGDTLDNLVDAVVKSEAGFKYMKVLGDEFTSPLTSGNLWLAWQMESTADINVPLYGPGEPTVQKILQQRLLFPSMDLKHPVHLKKIAPWKFHKEYREKDGMHWVYNRSREVYKIFNCQNMHDYMLLYMKIQCLKQAAVFQFMSDLLMKKYNLFICHSISMSSFSFDVAMFSSRSHYEYIRTQEIWEFVMKSVKGPIETSNLRYTKSNTERHRNRDLKEKRTEILYIDFNMLYPFTMLKPLPYKNYVMLSQSEIDAFEVNSRHQGYDFLLEVDLDYPPEFSYRDNCLPLGIQRRKLSMEYLSEKQQQTMNALKGKILDPLREERLVLDLFDKKNLLVYLPTLQYFVSKGLRIVKIHKILKFQIEAFLRPHIKDTSMSRTQAIREGDVFFSKLLKKLLVNCSGYMLKTSKNYTSVRPCGSSSECVSLAAKHNFKDIRAVHPNFSLFQMERSSIHCSAPLLCGAYVLEAARLEVYKGWDLIRSVWPDAKLVFCQTDSLCININDKEKKFIDNLKTLRESLDFSGLNPRHCLYSTDNQARIGKWKVVELNIKEVISIKSKVYSYLTYCDYCNDCKSGCEHCGRNDGVDSHKREKEKQHQFYRQLLNADGIVQIPLKKYKPSDIYTSKTRRYHSLNVTRVLGPCGIQTFAMGHRDWPHNGSGCLQL